MDNKEHNHTKNLLEMAEDIKNRHVSVLNVVKELFEKIETVDKKLNSFITVNTNALETAKKMDEELAAGTIRGPLHGVPIGLKDIIETKGIKTTMGSDIYKDYIPEKNSTVVKKLEEAGAIIIGKLNTHQFAYGPTGDRSYFGPARNPYNTDKMTGGSSSGSGAAVSAGLCYGALGTDTGGSVRIPSAFCGIVGMKPTYGTISKQGVYPLSWHLDHVGPMTRRIKDNAYLLNVLSGYDNQDLDAVPREQEDFSRFIGEDVNDFSIGVPKQFYFEGLDKEIEKVMDSTIDKYRELGVNVKSVELPDMETITKAHKVILRNDAFAVHEENLNNFPNAWDDELKERLYTALEDKGHDYARAIRVRKLSKVIFNQALENVDAILTPTMSIMPPKINGRYLNGEMNDNNHIRWTITKLTSPTDLNGFPSLTMPCGFSTDGMPIGAQLIGKEFNEAKIYQLGYALEQALNL
ncbi:amidase [Lentibacillus kapialis]|uniref:Amidase n=1 Tax=Lentibacillus kapialis TaxID=340214 RepID=A0A917Q1U4_9BACI|nr:amidase [Lentibacillus kapialis]GGK06875.1 amidase [Lentibacillus kapialis]